MTYLITFFAAGPDYIGCFDDKKTRILEGRMTSGNMTVEKCIQRCSMERKLLAGVEVNINAVKITQN